MMATNRILFASFPWHGHVNQLLVLARELVVGGYSVYFATGEAFRKDIIEFGIKFIPWDVPQSMADKSLLRSYQNLWSDVSQIASIVEGDKVMLNVIGGLYETMYSSIAKIYEDFLPELVIADSVSMHAIDRANQRGIPVIVIAQFLGNHVKASWKSPRFGTPFTRNMSPFEQVQNFFLPFHAGIRLARPLLRLIRQRNNCGVRNSIFTVYSKNKVFVTTGSPIELKRTIPKNMEMIGPILPRLIPPIPRELDVWLQDTKANEKVIFVSFGTLGSISAQQASKLITGLSNKNWRILWSMRKSQQNVISDVPANFRIEDFVQQLAVLAHPKVACFVSHCGMNSISESLFCGKPILGMPLFGDQHYNSARLLDFNVGLRLDKNNFSDQEVNRKIEELLNNPKYSDSAEVISISMRSNLGLDRILSVVKEIDNI